MTTYAGLDDPSPARILVRRLVADLGRAGAHQVLDVMLGKLSAQERAALAVNWTFWARPKQIIPADAWRNFGFWTGRGFGKTVAISHWVNEEVEAGRITSLGVAAQDEENTILVNIKGPSGLIATAPPWFRPEWESGEKILHWPNGARAIVRTPEVPGKIRGFDYDASWLSELQSWPKAKADEALSNFRLATRLGLCRIIWDTTSKRGNPLLRQLRAENERDPVSYRIVKGTTYENAEALGAGYIEDMENRIGGTRRGREELLGEDLDGDGEDALVLQEWINDHRAPMPERLMRRVLGIDPAVTTRAGNDSTGIIDAGLGLDARAYILGDYTGRHSPAKWAEILIEKYIAGRCDCIVLERNKAGDLVVQNLRAAAKARGLSIVVLEPGKIGRHQAGVINVREVYARGPKEDRAQPLSTAYQKGRVCHVFGIDLADLEETITTWEPTVGHRSPDRLDAEVHAVGELLGFSIDRPDPKGSIRSALKITQALQRRAGESRDDRI